MRSWHKGAFLLILLLCCLAGAVCLSLFTGSSSLSLGELYHALQAGDKTDTTYRIFLYVRLPRTLAAIFAGAALTVSGAIIQAVLNNSLASPNIIGVNSGAGFCALLAASLAPTAWAAVPLAALWGLLPPVCSFTLWRQKQGHPVSLWYWLVWLSAVYYPQVLTFLPYCFLMMWLGQRASWWAVLPA